MLLSSLIILLLLTGHPPGSGICQTPYLLLIVMGAPCEEVWHFLLLFTDNCIHTLLEINQNSGFRSNIDIAEQFLNYEDGPQSDEMYSLIQHLQTMIL